MFTLCGTFKLRAWMPRVFGSLSAGTPPERLIDEMLIARRIRLDHIDRVIALKFPAYLVPWHDKTLWLLHQYRQAYDLLDAGQSNIPVDAQGARIVGAIRAADNLAFSESRQIFTNAPTTGRRLLQYNGFSSTVLRPPLNDPELFTGGEADGYILATGRVNGAKRQHLLIQALKFAPGVRLVIAGPPDSAVDAEQLRELAASEGVQHRVILELRFLARNELAKLVNHSLAVAYLPFDEDSLGYCTMEAFQAAKPVITTKDAGGVLDIVRDDETGRVVEPEVEALASAMAALAGNPRYAARLGLAGRAAMDHEQLNWPSTIEKLLS